MTEQEFTNYELSPIGKQLETLFLEKRKEFPEVTLVNGSYGISIDDLDTGEIIYPQDTRCSACFLSTCVLGKEVPRLVFSTSALLEVLLESSIEGYTEEYQRGIIGGFDEDMKSSRMDKAGYLDGQYFRKKYLPTED